MKPHSRAARETSPSTCEESDSDSDVNSTVICPQCGQSDEEEGVWVQCDNPDCEVWQHVECTDIDPEEYDDLSAVT